MISEEINKKRKELELELKKLNEKEEQFKKQDSFKLGTNTAYLQNMKVFDGWTDFKEWVEVKHGQGWKGLNNHDVEVTFKIKKSSPKNSKANKKVNRK